MGARKLLGFFLFLLLINPVVAQEVEVINQVAPKPFAISHNVVFVVDASSTIYSDGEMRDKFNKAWDIITDKFASDELYVKLIIFNDKKMEKRTKWFDIGGPRGPKILSRLKKTVWNNTGIYSWGAQAIDEAIKQINPLDKNWPTRRRLTVVILSDGGFTEAADVDINGDVESLVLKGEYFRTGSFDCLDRIIERAQKWRVLRDLAPATILTIGIENTNDFWGTGVKRPDKECQAWLKKIGTEYNGGYFLVRNKK